MGYKLENVFTNTSIRRYFGKMNNLRNLHENYKVYYGEGAYEPLPPYIEKLKIDLLNFLASWFI